MSPADSTYITRFRTELQAILGRRSSALRDDALQTELVDLVVGLADIRRRYPDPVQYARVRSRYAIRNVVRHDNVGSGRGARYGHDDTGERVGGRAVVSGDAAHSSVDGEGQPLFSLIPAADPVGSPDAVADDLLARALLGRALETLSCRQRTVLYLVDGHGYTVTEVAQMLGVARETVSRIRSGALGTARGALQPPC